MPKTTSEEKWKPSKNPWLVTGAVMIAAFIAILDSTIANVAMPHMAGSFSSSNEEALWILTSYLVASGIILPSVNWFSKIFGRKKFFMGCIAVFTISSVLCGFANSLENMIFARILQGLGGGALMPLSQSILLESFPKKKRGLAMSVFGVGVLFAPIIGPLVGGWITDSFSWHWIFFINLPFGILAFICSEMFIEDPPYAQKQGLQKIDYMGFGFLITWLVTLQVVLDKGQNADWFSAPWICWAAAASALSMIGFFVSQLKNKHSIVDLSVFKDKNYALGTLLLFIIMGAMYASMAIMPIFLQNLLGYSAFLSGYAVMPRGLGCIISIIITGAISHKVNPKILIVTGLALLGSSTIMFGFLNLNINIMNIVLPNLLCGIAMGLCMIPLTTLSVNTLTNSQMTNATGLQSLIKEIGGAIGTSIVATLLSRYAQIHQFSMVKNLDPLNPAFTDKLNAMQSMFGQYVHSSVAEQQANYLMYAELLKQSSLWAFMDAFRIFGLITLMFIPLVFLLDKHTHDDSENMPAMH